MSIDPGLPGWRLSLLLDDRALFDTEAERRVTRYLVIGSAVIAAMLVLAMFMARGFGRQVQLARLKNDLVANVSHELKTPLTAMRALVETLLDTERFDEKTTREYLKLLATENARLSRLIDNFLTFSRLERNKFKFEFAPVAPQRIVEGAMAAMGDRAHAPGCTVESLVAAGIPEINGDADALTTALLNLLDNAWKYSGDDKHIVVRAVARDDCVSFAVEDNGVGLSPQEQRRVFQRFYQSDQRLARTVGGCGLGLSIVQSIVDAHRGSVRVESEVGGGSTFIMEIPAVTKDIT
jgi:signal transduction histidine kinase